MQNMFTPDTDHAVLELTEDLTAVQLPCQLLVWNDEVNTFDWVIKALVEICGHDEAQAEQCALIIHLRGKYAVKQGEFDTLKPMCEAIVDRGINATVEEQVS